MCIFGPFWDLICLGVGCFVETESWGMDLLRWKYFFVRLGNILNEKKVLRCLPQSSNVWFTRVFLGHLSQLEPGWSDLVGIFESFVRWGATGIACFAQNEQRRIHIFTLE